MYICTFGVNSIYVYWTQSIFIQSMFNQCDVIGWREWGPLGILMTYISPNLVFLYGLIDLGEFWHNFVTKVGMDPGNKWDSEYDSDTIFALCQNPHRIPILPIMGSRIDWFINYVGNGRIKAICKWKKTLILWGTIKFKIEKKHAAYTIVRDSFRWLWELKENATLWR